MVVTCSCGKISYPTRKTAYRTARHVAKRTGQQQRVYQCQSGVWHIATATRQELRR